jgi:hypothetical protein
MILLNKLVIAEVILPLVFRIQKYLMLYSEGCLSDSRLRLSIHIGSFILLLLFTSPIEDITCFHFFIKIKLLSVIKEPRWISITIFVIFTI